eukprot:7873-Heterococcus_DN1.PRE.3
MRVALRISDRIAAAHTSDTVSSKALQFTVSYSKASQRLPCRMRVRMLPSTCTVAAHTASTSKDQC